MAHDDTDEKSRVLAAKVFNLLAPIIGRELCECYVLPQICSFANDPASSVRNAVALNLVNLCNCLNPITLKNKLIPVYQTLSIDISNNVRKATVEILPQIANFCDKQIISKILLKVFLKFFEDESREVKTAILDVIGKFLVLLNKEDLQNHIEILDFYSLMIDEYLNNKIFAHEAPEVFFYYFVYYFLLS